MGTLSKLTELLDYDPHTGLFTRKVVTSNRVKIGDVAGSRHREGYWEICVGGDRYLAHRLAWFFVHGTWPKCEIDHINGNRQDNRIVNLRLADRSENKFNTKKPRNNTSGHKGVSWNKDREKWVARVSHYGKVKQLGYFKDKCTAINAVQDYRLTVHKEFTNHG